MEFDTLDWELEAQRVARAFGVEEKCKFVLSPNGTRQQGALTKEVERENERNKNVCFVLTHQKAAPEVAMTAVYFSDTGRGYYVFTNDETLFADGRSSDEHVIGILIGWDGSLRISGHNGSYKPILTRALFHLDLLSPEVEAALGVSISQHQKLEWALEYEGRVKP